MKRLILLFISLAAGLLIALPVSAQMSNSQNQSSNITSSANDNSCGGNNVINGGVSSFGQLSGDLNSCGVSDIFGHFGISAQDINQDASHVVDGTVNINNNVVVNGRVVAHNAMTAGREFIPGSQRVTSGGTTFFVRPPSVSFQQKSLDALVVMRNGQFAYAILTSCGNPVIGTPTTKMHMPAAPAANTTPTPAAPAPAQTQSQTQTQSQSQSQTVNVTPAVLSANTTTQQQTPTATAPVSGSKTLPNTGPGDILGLSGVATIFGTVGHYLFVRRRHSLA